MLSEPNQPVHSSYLLDRVLKKREDNSVLATEIVVQVAWRAFPRGNFQWQICLPLSFYMKHRACDIVLPKHVKVTHLMCTYV